MQIIETKIPEVFIIKQTVHNDKRGEFSEIFNHDKFRDHTGVRVRFKQTNYSRSNKNVLRGIHYQINKPQAKLIKVINGKILDVAVDLRIGSPTFGYYVAEELSSDNYKMLWIPEGFGHAFLVLSNSAEIIYQTTEVWIPEYDRSILWNTEGLNIAWPIRDPTLSDKDKNAPTLADAEVFKYR